MDCDDWESESGGFFEVIGVYPYVISPPFGIGVATESQLSQKPNIEKFNGFSNCVNSRFEPQLDPTRPHWSPVLVA